MYARTTTMMMDPARLDEVVRQLKDEEIPRFKEIEGFKGFTLLVNRDTGMVRAVSFWESADAMRASAQAMEPSRQRAARVGGASDAPVVEPFEVAIDTMV